LYARSSEDGMNETPQQYTERIVGYSNGQDPLTVQAATAGKLDRLIAGVPTAKLRERPAPGKWGVNEILAHLADAEIVIGFRLRFILGAPGSPVVAYDQDSWAASGHYDARDPQQSVEQFRVLREGNLALLQSLEPAQWKHSGMHSERGRETIEQIVRMAAGHDLNHLQQIEKILGRG
jgi:DinB family protein